MKLLIADKFEPHAIEELKHLGVEVVYDPEITKDSLPNKLAGVGILVVRSTHPRRRRSTAQWPMGKSRIVQSRWSLWKDDWIGGIRIDRA